MTSIRADGLPSAATLTTARTIGGVSFNGSANINLPGVNTSGTQNTSGNAATATALAANPTDCSAGQYATTIAANGNLTCAQVSYSQVGSAPTVGTAGALAAVTTVGATGADTNIPTEQGGSCTNAYRGNRVAHANLTR